MLYSASFIMPIGKPFIVSTSSEAGPRTHYISNYLISQDLFSKVSPIS